MPSDCARGSAQGRRRTVSFRRSGSPLAVQRPAKPASALTAHAGFAVIWLMGVLRSPHEATCPSIASRFFHEGASMSSPTTISPDKLARLIGTANTPALIDVRTDEDFAADPRLIPGAVRRNHQEAADWGEEFSGRPAIVVCLRGQKLAQGTAAWLRHVHVEAEALEGGFEGWKAAKLPLVPASKLPTRRARAHGLGHPRAAEDRPHRLPLADPALHRPECGVSVRSASRSGRGGRALQRGSLRY
jgi:rhodanese-related sulfurtransferase